MRIPGQLDTKLKPSAPTLQLAPNQFEQFESRLNAYHVIYSPLFYRKEQSYWSLKCLPGHFMNLDHKTTEAIALNVDGGNVRQMQHFKGTGKRNDAPIIQRHQRFVGEVPGSEDGAIILDDDYGKAPWLLDKIAATNKIYFAYVFKKINIYVHRGLFNPKNKNACELETEPRTVKEIVQKPGRKRWFKATVK